MRQDQFTTAAQQVLADSQSAAARAGHPEVTGLHVLNALLDDRAGSAASIFVKAGADAQRVQVPVVSELARQPKVSGNAGNTGRAAMTSAKSALNRRMSTCSGALAPSRSAA